MPVLRPGFVQVTDTPYKPGVLVGGDTALSDGSDSTYAEQWLSLRGGSGSGPTLIAAFDPAGEVTPLEDFFRLRYEVMNESGAAGTEFAVFINSATTGLEVGTFHQAGSGNIYAPSTDTIYELSGWEYVPSGTTTLAEVFSTGFQILVRRHEDGGTDGDWGIRVYEMVASAVLDVAIAGNLTPAVTRLYPRDDNHGISATNRIYPPPRATRIVGGQP